MDKLDAIQRKAARVIFHLPRDSHAEPLLTALLLESLREIIEGKLTRGVIHIRRLLLQDDEYVYNSSQRKNGSLKNQNHYGKAKFQDCRCHPV